MGRLNWKKGLDTLIPAFGQVARQNPDAFLVLDGALDNNYKQAVEKMITEANISDKILFTGSFPGKDEAALKDSDVFVLSSYSENFAVAVLHAMYFNLPVIITKYVGLAPYVSKNQAGIVVEKDEKELSEAILKILNNPNLAKKMGERGKYLVETEFSPEITAEKMISEYNKIK